MGRIGRTARRGAPAPAVASEPTGDEAVEAPPQGTPVGRRIFIGVLGIGAGVVALGDKLQAIVGTILKPITNASGGGLGAAIAVRRAFVSTP